MICPSCSNGILSPSFPIPLVLTYRSFKKVVGSATTLGCSSCSYEDTDSLEANVDMDQQMSLFKREINTQLSGGDCV